MMKHEESFFEGVASLNADHFTTDENIKIFEELQNKTDKPSGKYLRDVAKEAKIKEAIKLIDNFNVGRDDFIHSINELKELYKKRQLYYTIERAKNTFDFEDSDTIIEEFTESVSGMSSEDNKKDYIDPEEFADKMTKHLHEVANNPDSSKGIPFSITDDRGRVSGLPSLDQTFNGAQGGDLIMIAAKTGVGKTAFALNIARIFSMLQDYTVYYMNTEMREEELSARLIAPLARVDANEIETGRYEGSSDEISDKFSRSDKAQQLYRKGNFIPSVIPYLPLYKVKGLAKQIKLKYKKLDCIVVDYVGRMEMDDRKNIWDELYRITKGLKQLAVELDIPIFMLAQRNQAGDVEGAKKMMNECDGVLYFEPITEEDEDEINHKIRQDQRGKVNYRIVKKKVRRNDNSYPIYCMFNKARSEVVEARRSI